MNTWRPALAENSRNRVLAASRSARPLKILPISKCCSATPHSKPIARMVFHTTLKML
ncbi:Uncharacterised protein [Mycobacterium tuberculosis]|uniref:Uncharacterized protein n=1 Tax=Mycobacterium tuberculosis TaxID=1773 RepID=A0A916PBK2_MYCTX|nr:Uncharacterised protein [Mycobacterium tuberculosis]COX29567.1 Uncharacterised protein [Mycobacterium tuberculosis]COY02301.1 Uncharacterised protein [Mycobacterium tuberculosis]